MVQAHPEAQILNRKVEDFLFSKGLSPTTLVVVLSVAVLDESGKAERISKMVDFQIPIDVIDLSLDIPRLRKFRFPAAENNVLLMFMVQQLPSVQIHQHVCMICLQPLRHLRPMLQQSYR